MQIMSGFRCLFGPRVMRLVPCALWVALFLAPDASALDHITLRQGNRQRTVSGQVVVTAQDGGVLLLAADGTLWAIEPDDLIARRADDAPFEPLSSQDLARQLLERLQGGGASEPAEAVAPPGNIP